MMSEVNTRWPHRAVSRCPKLGPDSANESDTSDNHLTPTCSIRAVEDREIAMKLIFCNDYYSRCTITNCNRRLLFIKVEDHCLVGSSTRLCVTTNDLTIQDLTAKYLTTKH